MYGLYIFSPTFLYSLLPWLCRSFLDWCHQICLFRFLLSVFWGSHPSRKWKSFFHIIPSCNFTVSGVTLMLLFHFKMTFVYIMKWESNFILLHVDIQFYQHNLLKRLSFFYCILLAHLLHILALCLTSKCIEFFSLRSILICWSMYLFLGFCHDVLIAICL
jgi:hypothetical protein